MTLGFGNYGLGFIDTVHLLGLSRFTLLLIGCLFLRKKHAAHVALSSDAQANEPSVVLDIALRTSTIGTKNRASDISRPHWRSLRFEGPIMAMPNMKRSRTSYASTVWFRVQGRDRVEPKSAYGRYEGCGLNLGFRVQAPQARRM